MDCQFVVQSEGVLICPVCQRTKKQRNTPELHFRKCRPGGARPEPLPRAEPHGPGTELHALLLECGLEEFKGCKCRNRIRQMNRWGAACREHRGTIVCWLKESARKAGWWEKLQAANELRKRDWWRPLDPYGSLVDEAIRRAEAADTPPTPATI